MYIPVENLNSAVTSFKRNLKDLYQMEQIGKEVSPHYDDMIHIVNVQSKLFESLFGSDFLQKLNDEAWLEYTENL